MCSPSKWISFLNFFPIACRDSWVAAIIRSTLYTDAQADVSIFTCSLQVYHSVMLKYAPKRIQFSREGMDARTQLAAIDNNRNVGRVQATTAQGCPRFKSQFSCHKAQYVAKKIYIPKNYDYINNMMQQVKEVATGERELRRVEKHPRVSISRWEISVHQVINYSSEELQLLE